MSDLDRSYERLNRQEQSRARIGGDGATKSGLALARRYLPTLAGHIRADRVFPRDRRPWQALRAIDDETLALRILINGISITSPTTGTATRHSLIRRYGSLVVLGLRATTASFFLGLVRGALTCS
jgi:hypothetical protein